MGELLTIEETAERLRTTPSTVRRWIKHRGLPVHAVTTRTRYCDWDEVQHWLRNRDQAESAPSPMLAPGKRTASILELNTRRG
jgi:excisionase family DNA binding protein